MSHSNGEIYVDGTGSVTYGVSVSDVQAVIGNSSNDVGTLCTSNSINKWARYKPVIYEGFPIRFAGNTAFDAVTGLSIGSMISTPSSVAGYTDVEITYEKPTGGINSPYRLSDFNRYYHRAELPVNITFKTSFKKDKGMSATVNIFDRSSDAQSSLYISFADILNELSGYSSFKNSYKRLCMAVYDVDVSDTDPIWYFFSEKFTNTSVSGTMSVSTTSDFVQTLTVGKQYKFLVMLVSNIAALEVIVSGSREVWEYGVSPSTMATYESDSNPIQAMSLAVEKNMDWTERTLQDSSVVTDMTYHLDVLSVEKYGSIVASGNYNVLCTAVYLPTILVDTPATLNSSDSYQIRCSFSQGSTQFTNFNPTDYNSGNYSEIESTPSTSMSSINLTPWVEVRDIDAPTTITTGSSTYYEYEFDFPNHQYIILSESASQTSSLSSGIFLFFDQDTSAGSTFDLTFKLYYKPYSGTETLVRTITVTYSTIDGQGYVHDIDF